MVVVGSCFSAQHAVGFGRVRVSRLPSALSMSAEGRARGLGRVGVVWCVCEGECVCVCVCVVKCEGVGAGGARGRGLAAGVDDARHG